MDKVTITITSPEVIKIFNSLKKGTSKRFAVERAMEMLFADEKANELLFTQGEEKKKDDLLIVPNNVLYEKEKKENLAIESEKKPVKRFDF